jgi:hypothetical protein
MLKLFASTLFVCASLAGCALLSTNTTVQLAVQAAIDAGVGVVVAKNPVEGPIIASAAKTLQSLATGNVTTVATFINDADAKIASLPALNAPEKQSLELIVTLAATEITAGQSKLSATTSFDLGLVFGDIANAANIYASTSVRASRLAK